MSLYSVNLSRVERLKIRALTRAARDVLAASISPDSSGITVHGSDNMRRFIMMIGEQHRPCRGVDPLIDPKLLGPLEAALRRLGLGRVRMVERVREEHAGACRWRLATGSSAGSAGMLATVSCGESAVRSIKIPSCRACSPSSRSARGKGRIERTRELAARAIVCHLASWEARAHLASTSRSCEWSSRSIV